LLAYAGGAADAYNTLILTRPINEADRVAQAGPAASLLWFFEFMLLTPHGLASLYLMVTGVMRASFAALDDPRGDPILSGIDWAMHVAATELRRRGRQRDREAREGAEAPDVLITGENAGMPSADYVVIASRRKAEWSAGATILTSTDWYRLGRRVGV